MKCYRCVREQAVGFGSFIHIGNGDVFICGCEKHVNELIEIVRKSKEDDDT